MQIASKRLQYGLSAVAVIALGATLISFFVEDKKAQQLPAPTSVVFDDGHPSGAK